MPFKGELFDTSNVVVCQYDRISKARNKWKFNLKNGVRNLNIYLLLLDIMGL